MSTDPEKIRKKACLISDIIAYSHFDEAGRALMDFRDVHLEKVRQGIPDGRALLLTGPTGSGKSTILTEFKREHLAQFGDAYRILSFELVADCTPKQVAVGLASAMGDPLAARSTLAQLQVRIPRLAADQNLCMVVMDECQHLYSKTKNIQNEDAADTIKVLMDQLRIPFVMAGMPELRRMVDSNPQLHRRVKRRVELDAFDLTDPDDLNIYLEVLQEIDKTLPFKRSSRLSDRSIANAIHNSANGVFGSVKDLVARAAEIALDCDDLCIDVRHLATAHDELAAEDKRKTPNPFEPLVRKLRP